MKVALYPQGIPALVEADPAHALATL
jgi:hypothetical protein